MLLVQRKSAGPGEGGGLQSLMYYWPGVLCVCVCVFLMGPKFLIFKVSLVSEY